MGCPSMPVFIVPTVVYSEERGVEMANVCVCCGNVCNYMMCLCNLVSRGG